MFTNRRKIKTPHISYNTGAAFTPSAQCLRIQNLRPKKEKLVDPETNPIGKDGQLCYPPFKRRLTDEEKDEIAEEELNKKRKAQQVPGIVRLEDLLTGEHWRKKREKIDKKDKEKAMKMKIERMEIDYIPENKG